MASLSQTSEQVVSDYGTTYAAIRILVEQGILSRELCPTPGYWHWAILKPDELPESLAHFIPLGEVRW